MGIFFLDKQLLSIFAAQRPSAREGEPKGEARLAMQHSVRMNSNAVILTRVDVDGRVNQNEEEELLCCMCKIANLPINLPPSPRFFASAAILCATLAGGDRLSPACVRCNFMLIFRMSVQPMDTLAAMLGGENDAPLLM